MEPITLLLGLAAIVGTGALTKVGENTLDAEVTKIRTKNIQVNRVAILYPGINFIDMPFMQ
jgi:hypothetical protein